jgi:hypothetical protein
MHYSKYMIVKHVQQPVKEKSKAIPVTGCGGP